MSRHSWKVAFVVVLGFVSVLTIIRAIRFLRSTTVSAITTSVVAHHYDRFASSYDRVMRVIDHLLVGDGRCWVCQQARGDVLEIAIGTGRNLPYYPEDIHLTGVDISPRMLGIARDRANAGGVETDLRVDDAQTLDFPDGSFDTVVSTLAMCTIPDYERAISEAMRVMRPGGRFVALDHVRSPNPVVRTVQRLLNPLCVRLMSDHLLRDPAEVMKHQGLVIEQLEHSKLGIVERVVARTSV